MGFKAIGENLMIAHLMGTREKFEEGLKEAATEAGEVLVKTAHDGMDSASSPSPAGAYPSNVTGNLRAGIRFNATSNALYFKSTARHRHFLEDGTKNMEARPVIGNAVEDADHEVDKILKNKPFKRLS